MRLSIVRLPPGTPPASPFPMHSQSLLSFPNELLLLIADYLSPAHLSSLLRTSRHLSLLLTPRLHKAALSPKDGVPALHWAAARGHAPLVKLVLESTSTSIDTPDSTGKFALEHAVSAGRAEVVQLLLDFGAEFRAAGDADRGRVALHCAAREGNVQFLRERQELGAGAAPKVRREVPGFLVVSVRQAPTVAGWRAAPGVKHWIGAGAGAGGKVEVGVAVEGKWMVQEEGKGRRMGGEVGETPLDRALKLRRAMNEKLQKEKAEKYAVHRSGRMVSPG